MNGSISSSTGDVTGFGNGFLKERCPEFQASQASRRTELLDPLHDVCHSRIMEQPLEAANELAVEDGYLAVADE
jgi:hypothetical protein